MAGSGWSGWRVHQTNPRAALAASEAAKAKRSMGGRGLVGSGATGRPVRVGRSILRKDGVSCRENRKLLRDCSGEGGVALPRGGVTCEWCSKPPCLPCP